MAGIADISTSPSDDTGKQANASGLFTAWERRTRLWALVFAALTLAVSTLIALVAIRMGRPLEVTLALGLTPAFGVYAWQTQKISRRRSILQEPFPPEWEAVLQRDVVFFRILDQAAQQRFRRQVQVFLGEKQIPGIRVQVDTTLPGGSRTRNGMSVQTTSCSTQRYARSPGSVTTWTVVTVGQSAFRRST